MTGGWSAFHYVEVDYSSVEVQERRSGNQREIRRECTATLWRAIMGHLNMDSPQAIDTAVQDRLRLAPRGKARLPRILSQGSNKGPRMAATASPTQTNTPLHAPTAPPANKHCSLPSPYVPCSLTACPADSLNRQLQPAHRGRTSLARSRLAAPRTRGTIHSPVAAQGGPFVSQCHYATHCVRCMRRLDYLVAICRTTSSPCPLLSTADSNAPCGLVAF